MGTVMSSDLRPGSFVFRPNISHILDYNLKLGKHRETCRPIDYIEFARCIGRRRSLLNPDNTSESRWRGFRLLEEGDPGI